MSQRGVGLQELKKIKSYLIFTCPKLVGFVLVFHSKIALMAGISSKPRTTVSKNQELRYYSFKELGITVSKN